jgi:hypothetical protein
MQDVILAFAKTGNPAMSKAPFVRYAPDHEARVDFGDTITLELLNTKGMDFLETTPTGGRRGRGGRGAAGPAPAGR